MKGLAHLESVFRESDDRRAVFASAYLEITRLLNQWINGNYFVNGELTRRYIIEFAEFYRLALFHFECGDHDHVPGSWITSFQISGAGKHTFMEDLLLGINAHLNHDLPFALLRSHQSFHPEWGHRDYEKIGNAITFAIPVIRKKLVRHHQPWLRFPCVLLGNSIDRVFLFAFYTARKNAWEASERLAAIRSAFESRQVSLEIDDRANAIANAIIRRKVPRGKPRAGDVQAFGSLQDTVVVCD
ncbi:MAG: DUF5995 family protein [Verrucomicrobiales bacterium]|nr:DUF5995 family protein [Verrucomicrobiales bacterium]